MRKLKCPNCFHAMTLKKENIVYNGGKHDLWECEDCIHITVLDQRFEDEVTQNDF